MFSSKFIIYLLVFIVAVHLVATFNYWYWTYRWFDIPMHFLGGFWLAMVYFWFLQKTRINADIYADKRGFKSQTNADDFLRKSALGPHGSALSPRESALSPRWSALPIIIGCLGFVILIGVLWEFLEFLYDFFLSRAGYTGYLRIFNGVAKDMYTDTIGDLFFDLVGGLVFAVWWIKVSFKPESDTISPSNNR